MCVCIHLDYNNLPSCKDVCVLFSDVYLSMNGSIIPNHGYVVISDIGTAGDDTALLCHTNRPPESFHRGHWFGPDGTTVLRNFPGVPGFRRNRGPMVVHLYRSTVSTESSAEGIYYCQIQDNVDILQTITVGLYNSTEGIVCLCIKSVCVCVCVKDVFYRYRWYCCV